MGNFQVVYRNFGHWDIYTDKEKGRAFRIRGGPSKYIISDERDGHFGKEWMPFKTVQACMSYICDELMYELIAAKSQKVEIIEDWNISD